MQGKLHRYKRFNIYYVVTLLFILLSSNANVLSSTNICWMAILVFFTAVYLAKRLFTLKDFRVFCVFSVCYLLLVFLRDYYINNLNDEFFQSDVIFLCKYIYTAFLFCAIVKNKAIAYIVQVIADLTVISFLFFALQLLAPALLYKTFMAANLPNNQLLPGYSNLLVFTFHKGLHDFANSGFAWEPGAFGCFLVIGLVFHFFLNEFKFDKKAWLFIAAVITTFSTTACLALLVVIFLALRYRAKVKARVLLFIPLCVVVIMYVPFLGGKIKYTYHQDMDDLKHLAQLDASFRRMHQQIPLDRFSSMVFVYRKFGAKLICGVNNRYDVFVNTKYNINVSNGIFEALAQFGLIGLIYLAYCYIKFCRKQLLNAEQVLYCLAIMFILSFGEPILGVPLLLAFMFLPKLQVKLNTFFLLDIKEKPLNPFIQYSAR
nr:hypothetical protein [uncultured Mucilaginibacter sp.]